MYLKFLATILVFRSFWIRRFASLLSQCQDARYTMHWRQLLLEISTPKQTSILLTKPATSKIFSSPKFQKKNPKFDFMRPRHLKNSVIFKNFLGDANCGVTSLACEITISKRVPLTLINHAAAFISIFWKLRSITQIFCFQMTVNRRA